jgi:hypothetical protein
MGQPLGQDMLSWDKGFQETITSSGAGVSRQPDTAMAPNAGGRLRDRIEPKGATTQAD